MKWILAPFILFGIAMRRLMSPGYMILLAIVTLCAYVISVRTAWYHYSDKWAFVNIGSLLTFAFGYLYVQHFGPANERQLRLSGAISLFVGLLVGIFAAYTKEVLSITSVQVAVEFILSVLYVCATTMGMITGGFILWVIGKVFFRQKKTPHDYIELPKLPDE